MIKKFAIALILAITLALGGCVTFGEHPVETQVVVKYKYVVKLPPDDVISIPAPIEKIDVSKASDKDVAFWISNSEQRTVILEKKLAAVKKYYDDLITTLNVKIDDIIKD